MMRLCYLKGMERDQQIGRRSPRNRTIKIDQNEEQELVARCIKLDGGEKPTQGDFELHGRFEGQIAIGDAFSFLPLIPDGVADLVLFDPPYNMRKDFHGWTFRTKDHHEYMQWISVWLHELVRIMKPGASMYLCSEWRSSASVQIALGSVLSIRNRITWEREKGRGSLVNWKNASEDIWFATKGENHHFDAGTVKLRRKVIAPYRDGEGNAKDWVEGEAEQSFGGDPQESSGSGKYRDTFAGNIWTDLTVPFWSMAENTDHPTQKPEKLAAKLILASSPPGAFVFDPCAGSGSFIVTAKKLGRRCFGIEQNPGYAAVCRKRLDLAATDSRVQGYENGVFYERNSQPFV